jgi:hypothetical protein
VDQVFEPLSIIGRYTNKYNNVAVRGPRPIYNRGRKWPNNGQYSITQHSLQFASTYTPLVMLFHANFKIGTHNTQHGLKNINKLYRYTIGKWVSLISSSMT